MFNNGLKLTFRNLLKNKLFALINVLGLGVALVCCIVAFLNWDYNAKFDSFHNNTENVYRVNFIRMTNNQPIQNGSCPLPLGDQIRTSVGQVGQVIRYFPIGGNFKIGNEVFRTKISAVDPEFFEVFNFPLVDGKVLSRQDKQSILISEELRDKHFPEMVNPVGEVLSYISGDQRHDFQVIGVFEQPPQNTSFQEGAFILYEHTLDVLGWEATNWANFNTTFVTIDNPGDVAQVENQLQQYVAIQNEAKKDYKVKEYYLDPFVGMAVRAEREDVWNHWLSQSLPTSAAIAPGIMAFLLLLIACFNFTNTSIAIANRRIREIGIRKVLGSNRLQLIVQFMGENLAMVVLAMMVALILAIFLVPAYSAMWPFLDLKFKLLDNVNLLGFLVLLMLFTALIAGSYPAFYVSSFQPTTIFRGTVKFSGTNPLTRILLTLQYAISLLAIISAFVFSQNATYQEEYDMGFNMETIVSADVNDERGYTKLRNALLGYGQIKEMAGSRHSVSSNWYTDPIKYKSIELDVSIFDVGAGYLSTIGATLLKGRDFMENSQLDATSSVIVNEELVRTLGWSEALGKRIVLQDTVSLTVIGVVKDIFFRGGLWDPLEPMLLRYATPEQYRFLSVRADTKDLLTVKTLMDEKWKTIFPDELSTVRFMDEEKAASALVNKNIKLLFIFLGIVAVLLSVSGLFSLVTLNITRRMKEIGVRKVLGASIQSIGLKVSREFIFILTVASVLGCLGAYYLTGMLMGSIWTYYVPPKIMSFAISVGLLLFISALTIGGKVFRAASENPADILRTE